MYIYIYILIYKYEDVSPLAILLPSAADSAARYYSSK